VTCKVDDLTTGRELGDHLRCRPPTFIVEIHEDIVSINTGNDGWAPARLSM
jgi:hypothetical protein